VAPLGLPGTLRPRQTQVTILALSALRNPRGMHPYGAPRVVIEMPLVHTTELSKSRLGGPIFLSPRAAGRCPQLASLGLYQVPEGCQVADKRFPSAAAPPLPNTCLGSRNRGRKGATADANHTHRPEGINRLRAAARFRR
jgi:hypothetical protein